MPGEQRLVRGHHRLAVLQCGQDGVAGRFHRPHQFHDDIDVLARHQVLDVVSQHRHRHAAVVADPAHRHTAQFQRRTDAGSQVGRTLLDDAHHLAPDVAHTEHRDADRLLVGHRTSKLNRSSMVSRRKINRALPSRTATTAGRPIKLYLLDIE